MPQTAIPARASWNSQPPSGVIGRVLVTTRGAWLVAGLLLSTNWGTIGALAQDAPADPAATAQTEAKASEEATDTATPAPATTAAVPKADPSAGERPQSPPVQPLDEAGLNAAIQQLDSDSFAERQSAMARLKSAGVGAIPALVKGARTSNPEVAARIVKILTSFYVSEDAEVAIAADEALETLGESGPAVALIRTQDVLQTTLAPLRRRHAIVAVKRLGGHVIPTPREDSETHAEVESDLNEDGTVSHVVLGKNWAGGIPGLKYLKRIPELRMIYITTAIPLNPEEQDRLKTELAGMRIEQRGSAFLGIKSMIQDPEICVVDSVVPNSPAKRGGLKPGDIITHVDGLPIHGFLSLTSNLSSRKGGETVYLEVLRAPVGIDDEAMQELELAVELGEW